MLFLTYIKKPCTMGIITEKKRSQADLKHDERLLNRIQTLIDVVYGLILFQLFLLLPKPTKELIAADKLSELFQENGAMMLTVVIGIVWVIIYWGQSNTQFGYLKRTNKTLSSLAIIQLFLLMLYLYFIKLDNETGGDVLALFSQSICLALAGFMGVFSWFYATRNNMLFDDLESDEQQSMYYKFMPEPIAALITVPLAFVDVFWYTVGWLSVIPMGFYFKRRLKKQSNSSESF